MLPSPLAAKWPKLRADGAEKKSDASIQYNCIAWAAERDQKRWWQPEKKEPWDYWPPGIPDDGTFDCFVALFESIGYKKCTGRHLEVFYEKVALYSNNSEFTHVASQLQSGIWTSKLGPEEDIEHNSLESLEGTFGWEYGEVKQMLKRRCHLLSVIARAFFKLRSIVSKSD